MFFVKIRDILTNKQQFPGWSINNFDETYVSKICCFGPYVIKKFIWRSTAKDQAFLSSGRWTDVQFWRSQGRRETKVLLFFPSFYFTYFFFFWRQQCSLDLLALGGFHLCTGLKSCHVPRDRISRAHKVRLWRNFKNLRLLIQVSGSLVATVYVFLKDSDRS